MKVLLSITEGGATTRTIYDVSDDVDLGAMIESSRLLLVGNGFDPTRISILDASGETLADWGTA